jgi:hypothetical protein
VSWLSRIARPSTPAAAAPDRPVPEPIERLSPGVAALFGRMGEDGGHAVLDLGPAVGSSLRVYSGFARWVRFADLLATGTSPAACEAALRELQPNPDRPYDLVVGWDVLDRLPPAQRPSLVRRLAELTAPDAALFVVLGASDAPMDLVRFALAGIDRVRYTSTGEGRSFHTPLLPAEVKRLLAPFQVRRAFSSQLGFREYLAVREMAHVDRGARSPVEEMLEMEAG